MWAGVAKREKRLWILASVFYSVRHWTLGWPLTVLGKAAQEKGLWRWEYSVPVLSFPGGGHEPHGLVRLRGGALQCSQST